MSREPKREVVGHCHVLLLLAGALAAGPAVAAEVKPVGSAAGDARTFIETAERRLQDLSIRVDRADWVQQNFITTDTEEMAAHGKEDLIAAVMEYAREARRFEKLKLPDDVARKLALLKQSVELPAPTDPSERAELTRIAASLESAYGRGRYCPGGKESDCLDVTAITRIMAESRDPERLLDVWRGWHRIAPPMREPYRRFAELADKGARELGYADLGTLWRSEYDMPPEAFDAEAERLWRQVAPLYWALHAHVRAALGKTYGTDLVPPGGTIPAHLLGNIWAQDWSNLYPLVAPPGDGAGFDLAAALRARKVDPREMVRYGERFFTSLGFEPLPDTFWERSLFLKPADRDVVCHASAWDIDSELDLRIKMCIEITDEDFRTIHHELGHNFYQRAYRHQPTLFREGANGAFHEAIGDTIALSITPDYLRRVGLLDKDPTGGRPTAGGGTPAGATAPASAAAVASPAVTSSADLGLLMRTALTKVAFLPFGLLVDKWRWKVFSGEVGPADYNRAWWDLRRQYQGVAPPVPRDETDFDPGAKYHVPANVSYTRYFLADILQFQFHRALCREAGYRGPLHLCSIYDNKEAGARLRAMLEMGRSRPWPEALRALTGETSMDASAMLEYFAPLRSWLDEQNQGRKVGL